ncbi:MFS transporter [Paraburkholderia sp. SIMBA_030]|uniref:MFS transporter n=1 Tax=Paraburkholderia sp. SIMBA_030 TaxID=3085773 RepID=UPI0039786E7F
MDTPPWRKLMAGSVGNFVELYDFAVFGFSVPILSSHFFPGNDRTAALLSTFAVFAVAFVARPLGGLIFGSMADRIGRVKVMAITVCLMALGTAVIGLLPTYAEIGMAAPIMLVMCRLLQGLALGGETTGSQSYIVESAPNDRRGQWVSFTQLFGQLPNAIVAVLLIAVQAFAGSAAYESRYWRIPFLIGGVIGIVGFWIRRNVDEPEEFKQAIRTKESRSPLRDAFHAGGIKAMLRLLMIMPVYFAGAYILFGFMYTFLIRVAKLEPTTALITNAISVVVLCSIMPFAGILSDRIGRKRVMSLGAAWLMLTAYPAIHFAASGTFAGALLGQVLIGIGLGVNGGASYVAAVEFFPTKYRATGHAISYQITVAILGGTSPFIAAYLSRLLDTPFAPGLYLAFIAAACLIATQFVPETRGVRLRTSVESSIGDPDRIALQKAR